MILYGYYDYTPDDAIVQYITEDDPKVIHLYNRDGVYKGTITDPLIVSRAVRNWRNETVPAIKLFLVMVAECFPEKLEKRDLPNMPAWHPYLPANVGCKKKVVKFLTGPHQGGSYTSSEIFQYLMLEDQQEYGDPCHLYRLELDPTVECGYVHVLSGAEADINKYCLQNNIRCLRNGR